MIRIFLFLLLSAPLIGMCQDDTYNFGEKTSNSLEISEEYQGEVMVVPFELRLYYSYFDKHFVRENNLGVEAVREKFRRGLIDKIAEVSAKSKRSTSPSEDGSFNESELTMIHKSLTYSKADVPIKEEKSKAEEQLDKLKAKFKKKKPKKEPKTGTYIENGQLVTVRDTKEKYMKSEVKNADFLFALNEKYTSETFIIINQLEILYPQQMDQTAIQSGEYPREIRVHYTIIDKEGKEINGGLAKNRFPNTINNIDQIIENYFPAIAEQIVADIPVEEEAIEE